MFLYYFKGHFFSNEMHCRRFVLICLFVQIAVLFLNTVSQLYI